MENNSPQSQTTRVSTRTASRGSVNICAPESPSTPGSVRIPARLQRNPGQRTGQTRASTVSPGDDVHFFTAGELCRVFPFPLTCTTCARARGNLRPHLRAGAHVDAEDYSEDRCSSVCCVSLVSQSIPQLGRKGRASRGGGGLFHRRPKFTL